MGSPFTQELGARAGQGAKCLPRLHPPSSGLGHISPCLSTNSMITPITPASSAGAGEASHCPKGEPKLNFPVQSHFQKLWVPYCSHWLHFALQTHDHTAWQCWSWRQLLTLGHILYQLTWSILASAGITCLWKQRNFHGRQRHRQRKLVQAFPPWRANVVCACIQLP